MSFNLEVQGGKNYLLPTGGKYCPQDIEIAAIGGATEGMFCWQKKDPNTLVVSDIGYANASSYMNISENNGVYSVSTSSGGGWGVNYINTKMIDTTKTPLRIVAVVKAVKNHFIGFADSQATGYSAMNESLYLTSGKAINHQRKGAQVAGYGSFAANDTIVLELYQGYFSASKNGTQLFKTATTLTSACFVGDFYETNTNYGDYRFETEAPTDLGYVLSDDINAYPQDGLAPDGFYYKLLENDIPWDERGRYAWAQYDTPPYRVQMDKVAAKNMTIAKGSRGYTIKSTSAAAAWGAHRLDIPLPKKVVFYPQDTSLYLQIGVTKDSNTIEQSHTVFGMAFYIEGTNVQHFRGGAFAARYGTFALGDVFTIEFTDTEMQVYKNGTFLFSDNTFNSTYTKLSLDCYQASATIGDFEFGEEVDPIGYAVSNDESAYPNDDIASDGYYYTKVGATKVTIKSASGTCAVSPYTTTVTGLDFKPYAVIVRHTHYLITAMNASDGTTMTVQGLNGSCGATVSGTFVANDGGFTLTCNAIAIGSTFDFYAVGV